MLYHLLIETAYLNLIKMIIFSIIIPVYNAERYILDCIKSIISQTYSNIECIFVDDCSHDKSADIIKNFIENYHGDLTLKLISCEENHGQAYARNIGIRNATGDYVVFLDSDDKLAENCLQIMYEIIGNEKDTDFIQCQIDARERNPFDMSNLPSTCLGRHNIFRLFLTQQIACMPHGKAVRLSFIEHYSLYFQDDLRYNEDLQWVYFICKKAEKFKSCQETVYYYNTENEESTMHKADRHFDQPAYDFFIVLNNLLDNIDETNFIQNKLYIDNTFFYVARQISKCQNISVKTTKSCKHFYNRLTNDALRHGNLIEYFYLIHTRRPFVWLLNYNIYRRLLFVYEKLTRWHYRIINKKK